MESVRNCFTCAHAQLAYTREPCAHCWHDFNRWEAKVKKEQKSAEGVKYDNGKPMLSLIGMEFARILYRQHPNRSAVGALISILALVHPDNCTPKNFSKSLFAAIDALASIDGHWGLMNQCAVAMGPTGGLKKYNRNNWRLGMDALRLIDAASRHMAAYLSGELVDAETGAKHYGNAAFCLQCIAEYLREPGTPHMLALFETSKRENWECESK